MVTASIPRTAVQLTLAVCLVAGLSANASAHVIGVFGFSGKQGATCTQVGCHAGGVTPDVQFTGPSSMDAGATAIFQFTITSHSANQVAAGLDVAVSAGTLGSIAGQGTQLVRNEITHAGGPKTNDANAQASFEFTWQAPATPGTYILYGAGNSVNGDSLSTGDAAAATTYSVVVGASGATPTPTETPQPVATATATATPPASTCVGDCSGDGQVTVDELILGVNIALGSTQPTACPVFDFNGDGEVTIDEILRAVNNALGSCPA